MTSLVFIAIWPWCCNCIPASAMRVYPREHVFLLLFPNLFGTQWQCWHSESGVDAWDSRFVHLISVPRVVSMKFAFHMWTGYVEVMSMSTSYYFLVYDNDCCPWAFPFSCEPSTSSFDDPSRAWQVNHSAAPVKDSLQTEISDCDGLRWPLTILKKSLRKVQGDRRPACASRPLVTYWWSKS